MGKLYVVSTPIGNLKDITLRAIEVLSRVDLIACEDTRKTGLLLSKLQVKNRPALISYFEANEKKKIPRLITRLLSGETIALVTSAGTPAISDPGFKLIRESVRHDIPVESIPGPSAVISALVVSGFPTDKFVFLGYLPKKPGKRRRLLEKLAENKQNIPQTTIIFVSPHRLIRVLQALKDVFGPIDIVLIQEFNYGKKKP